MEAFAKLLNPTDILFHIINVLVLFVAIRLLLYKPIRKFMDGRAGKVEAALADAAQKREQAAALQAEVDAQARQAKIDAAQAVAQGVQQAQKTGEEILSRAREQAEGILAQAHAQAKEIRLDAKETVRTQAVNMAVEIAGRMLEREVKADDHQKIIGEFLTKVG